jgi:molybdopterin-guanine dinucleotide biosynthesis protein A
MGRSKHDLVLSDGRTMIDLVHTTCSMVAEHIVLAGPEDILPELPHVQDRFAKGGPLSGIEAVLHSKIADRYIIVPCDMPTLQAEDLERLIDADTDLAIFHSAPSDPLRGLPMCIHVRMHAALTAFLESDQRAVHRFIASCEHVLVDAPSDPRRLENINNPDDWNTYMASRSHG